MDHSTSAPVEAAVVAQARMRACGVSPESCAERLLGWPPGVLIAAVENVVVRAVRRALDSGWRPTDLDEMQRRHLDARAQACLFDVVRAVAYSRLTSDPTVLPELDTVAPNRWLDPRRPVLPQRTERERWSIATLLGAALDVLVRLRTLPVLPSVTPDTSAMGDAEVAMLVKVRALLAKAERTEFEHEAEAFTAKAQELMARYSIDAATVGTGAAHARGTTLRRIWLDTPYVSAKFMIVAAVAGANRCRALLGEGLGCASVVGMTDDVRATVLVATSLLIQAARASARARPDERGADAGRTRSFRRSFLLAYATRIGERLREVAESAESDVDPDRLLPVLASRRELVERAVAEYFPLTRPMRVSSGDPSGWAAGRAAADLAQLGGHSSLEGTG